MSLTFLLKITTGNKDTNTNPITDDLETPIIQVGKSSEKNLREILKLNDAIHQMYLTYLQNILSKHQGMYFIFSIP